MHLESPVRMIASCMFAGKGTRMESKPSKSPSLFAWILVAGLLSQGLLTPAMSASFDDEKNYYAPDPHAGSPPTGSHHTPSHGTPPSGGNCGGTPPHHQTPPCGGGGSYNPAPPTPSGGNCGSPPYDPRSPPFNPTPTPSTPKSPPYSHTPTPSTPTSPPYSHTPTPSTPTSPPYSHTPTPSTPLVGSPPPTTPGTTPGTPGFPAVPTPPFLPDPNSNPFTGSCNFWRNHPGLIWGLFGGWTTLGGAFGAGSFLGLGANLSLQQALSNTRTDGLEALYREGTASLLNSMVNRNFPLTTQQVREHFISALGSNKAATAQARIFKLANEGQLKPRA